MTLISIKCDKRFVMFKREYMKWSWPRQKGLFAEEDEVDEGEVLLEMNLGRDGGITLAHAG